MVGFIAWRYGRDRIVVSTSRCGRDNPGSNPGHGRDVVGLWRGIATLIFSWFFTQLSVSEPVFINPPIYTAFPFSKFNIASPPIRNSRDPKKIKMEAWRYPKNSTKAFEIFGACGKNEQSQVSPYSYEWICSRNEKPRETEETMDW